MYRELCVKIKPNYLSTGQPVKLRRLNVFIQLLRVLHVQTLTIQLKFVHRVQGLPSAGFCPEILQPVTEQV